MAPTQRQLAHVGQSQLVQSALPLRAQPAEHVWHSRPSYPCRFREALQAAVAGLPRVTLVDLQARVRRNVAGSEIVPAVPRQIRLCDVTLCA